MLCPQANSPNAQQAPTSIGEISGEVDHLEESKPLQRFEVAIAILEGNNAVFIPWVLQCKRDLSFHPHGVDSIGGEKYYKPVTTLQGTEDFILPLLGTNDILWAEECRNSMMRQNSGETLSHDLILVRMRQEYLGWCHRSFCKGAHLGNHLLPVFFTSADLHRIQFAKNPRHVRKRRTLRA